MPTGYTADIANKEVTFREFALTCARAFGATIDMRDESMDAPIPEEFKPGDYHSKKLVSLKDDLSKLESISAEDAKDLAEREYQENLKNHQDFISKKQELAKKYNVLLEQAQAWEPPTPEHIGLKDFMVKQLQQSLDFDCDISGAARIYSLEQKTGGLWLADKIAKVHEDIAYHTKGHAEDLAKTQSRNDWVKALRNSI